MPVTLSPVQAVPGIIKILQDYSLTVDDICRASDQSPEIVCDALSIHAFESCPLFIVAAIRNSLHELLIERGWQGKKDSIWGEHDIRTLFARR